MFSQKHSESYLFDGFSLAPELVHLIIRRLSPGDLVTICMVNRAWKHYCKNSMEYNKMWHKVCMDEWFVEGTAPSMTHKDKKKDWKQAFFKHGSTNHDGPWLSSIREQQYKNSYEYKLKSGQIKPMNSYWCLEEEQNGFEAEEGSNNKKPSWTKNGMSHEEYRAYYKGKRAKPKGKKPVHHSKELFC